MGTRGLIGYILRNKQRKAMYNHWDSYPEGQGHDIAQFISRLSPEQSKEMAERVEKIEANENAIIPEDIKKRYLAYDGIWKYDFPYGGPEHWFHPRQHEGLSEDAKRKKIEERKKQAAKSLAMRASLGDDDGPFAMYGSMDTWSDVLVGAQGARALPFIQEGKLNHLIDSISFMGESIFCEWEYFIDFHNEKLEVWAGKLLREVSFDTLRADPNYMLKGGWSDESDEE
ncbi:hypothetical protein L198_08120 [Cryptococcus wingfieldii CBS 7118]|uniref:Uncharacterized protein n=1 Tax=Cryptococcus wingfieldii CBS 7118 TaxID=1295528 RepID=A0A1E3HJ27_9TREE|nr:hypothetical protein L198_08120 [Cryptococcus wingfieldii CBS 7118]ODN76344.1 hypothetical protein L198_08120 [Cryptococcus wingfieldii CBS 7118]